MIFSNYIPITFNNHFKACFEKEMPIVSIQTRTTQIKNNAFLIDEQDIVTYQF